MQEFETILYEERVGFAWVTSTGLRCFTRSTSRCWGGLDDPARIMRNDDVRCGVVTATGEKAFCVGIDREETIGNGEMAAGKKPGYVTAWCTTIRVNGSAQGE